MRAAGRRAAAQRRACGRVNRCRRGRGGRMRHARSAADAAAASANSLMVTAGPLLADRWRSHRTERRRGCARRVLLLLVRARRAAAAPSPLDDAARPHDEAPVPRVRLGGEDRHATRQVLSRRRRPEAVRVQTIPERGRARAAVVSGVRGSGPPQVAVIRRPAHVIRQHFVCALQLDERSRICSGVAVRMCSERAASVLPANVLDRSVVRHAKHVVETRRWHVSSRSTHRSTLRSRRRAST